jgi:hypothetical protein
LEPIAAIAASGRQVSDAYTLSDDDPLLVLDSETLEYIYEALPDGNGYNSAVIAAIEKLKERELKLRRLEDTYGA